MTGGVMSDETVRATAFSKLSCDKLRLAYEALLAEDSTLVKVVIAKNKKKDDIIVILRGCLLQCRRIS